MHQRITDRFPVLQHGRRRVSLHEGAQQHGHLPAGHDHRPESAKCGKELLARGWLVRPDAHVSPATGLEVLAHAVAEDTIEVERENVRDVHRQASSFVHTTTVREMKTSLTRLPK